MHKIDTEGAVAGQFVIGNPQTGQRPTRLGADWPNAVQAEIVNVIEAANIALVKGDNTQLFDAIIALIAGVVGSGGGSVPTTRQVLGGGLIGGGGPLAADLTLTLAKLTSAEILAGVVDTKVPTALGLATALGGTIASNYILFPGGLLIQWGTQLGSYVEGAVFRLLPTSFIDANYAINITAINQSGDLNKDVFTQRVSKSAGSFTTYLNYDGSGSTSIDGFEFIAIGRGA
jgi:hypothetical protein